MKIRHIKASMSALSVHQLQARLRERNLLTSGNKNILIHRLCMGVLGYQ